MGQRRELKNPWEGEEDVFLVHPQNGLNGLVVHWWLLVHSSQQQQRRAHAQKSVINMMIRLLLNVSDWPIKMIGPGGSPLVVPHLFAVPISVLWVRLQKVNN